MQDHLHACYGKNVEWISGLIPHFMSSSIADVLFGGWSFLLKKWDRRTQVLLVLRLE